MTRLYGDFSGEEWRSGLSVPSTHVPRSLVLHGQFAHEHNLERWKELLGPDVERPQWNTLLGAHEGVTVGFANVIGGPMASMVAHPFCAMGTQRLIQTGYFGGLSEEAKYGDILIVSGAKPSCGVASCYGFDGEVLASDHDMVDIARAYCDKRGWSYTVGTVHSTDAICLETAAIVRRWSEEGHAGVDMETSATFSAAHRFGRRAIGLLNLSDHLLRGDHLMNYTDERKRLERQADAHIRELALHLATVPVE